MCSQQVDNLNSQVDYVNVEPEYEPSFQLIPPFGEYDYKELVVIDNLISLEALIIIFGVYCNLKQ